MDISNSDTATAVGIEIDTANIDGQGNLFVTGYGGRNHHAAALQLSIHERAAVTFDFL